MEDDGRPDPRLAAALVGWRAEPGPAAEAEVLAALAGARVFVPMRAVATQTGTDPTTGLRAESSAAMELLLVAGRPGTALPAFPDGNDVQRWQATARPVPLPGPQACAAALDQGAVALLLDPLGALLPVTGLAELAAGRVPVPGTGLSTRSGHTQLSEPDTVDPALLATLGQALRGEPVAAARLLQSPDGPVVGVVPVSPLTPAQLAALAAGVATRAGAALPAGGVDLTVVAADGPGVPVLADVADVAPGRRWPARGTSGELGGEPRRGLGQRLGWVLRRGR